MKAQIKVGTLLLVQNTMYRCDNGTAAYHHYVGRVTRIDHMAWYEPVGSVYQENTVTRLDAVGGGISLHFIDEMIADGSVTILRSAVNPHA